MLYHIFVSSKYQESATAKSFPILQGERKRWTIHFLVILNLYSLTTSMCSTEGKPTLWPCLRPVWIDLQVFGGFSIRKNLSVSYFLQEPLLLLQLFPPRQNL